jgi:hypothetical protein
LKPTWLCRGWKLLGSDGDGWPEAVPLDEPSRVVDILELDQRVAELLDGVKVQTQSRFSFAYVFGKPFSRHGAEQIAEQIKDFDSGLVPHAAPIVTRSNRLKLTCPM